MSLNFFSFDEIFYPKPIDKNTFQIVYPLDAYFYKNINTTFDIGYINKYTKDTGSYIIIINSNIVKQATFFDSLKKGLDWQQSTLLTNAEHDTDPNAIFCISKSNKLHNGSINKLSCSKNNSSYEDSLSIEWNPCEYPLLKYNKYKNTLKDNRGALNQGQNDNFEDKNLSLVFNIKVLST